VIGTLCDYEFVVPATSYESSTPWLAKARKSAVRRPQMLGDVARVKITHVSPRPGVLYSSVVLAPGSEPDGGGGPLHFHVDRTMTTMLRPGDVVHICRTGCGGVALSVVRDDELLAAAGAVCSVPLGRTVMARYPHELIAEALAVFRRHDPEFLWHEAPVEVSINGERRELQRGIRHLGGYEVFMVHGAIAGTPGDDACLAISRLADRVEVAANSTALLLDAPAIAGGPNCRF
jgi:hypothetical protein